jgi:hypothetical protein
MHPTLEFFFRITHTGDAFMANALCPFGAADRRLKNCSG